MINPKHENQMGVLLGKLASLVQVTIRLILVSVYVVVVRVHEEISEKGTNQSYLPVYSVKGRLDNLGEVKVKMNCSAIL